MLGVKQVPGKDLHAGLVRYLKQKRLLLVLDNLHWTDESSLELLTYLVRHLDCQRILFVHISMAVADRPQANDRDSQRHSASGIG